ncbi:uncharacterized protein [Enoplosus armatus]|uniref:uncharacterized protein n=1 Tax=Enoplosus armatus TaxID=215367 RepID=UPI003993F298
MASAQASPRETSSLEKHLTCSICLDSFVDPVTTNCGHSFCKECLHHNFICYDTTLCPLCKQHQSKTPGVNIVLRNIVEQTKKTQEKDEDKYTGAPGEVACDICTVRKLKAKKSCLVCLASYCSAHLENHSSTERLKGHKLVEPVENLDDRACLQHGRPLELYSRKKEKCICVRCMEGGQEEVVSTEDEWNKKKAKLENIKTELQEKVKKRKARVDEINTSFKSCKDQVDNEWWDIDRVFEAVIAIVKVAQARALKPLEDRRKAVEKEAKDLIKELEGEINELEKTISELDDISALEDHILFLQSYPSLKDPDNIKDWTEVELDTSLSFGTMRKTTTTLLEQIQQELETLTSTELQRVPKFTVDIKLDRATAHQRLVVSDDGKEVKDGGEDQEVADARERFDLFASILGLNRLTSGKSYWEVEVSNKTGWDLGVARSDANRKGKLSLNPDNGYWVTVHYEDEKYAALTDPPIRLSLKEKPKKVGVFVDYEEGLVSFYDVTAQSHIYSFTECSFSDELSPYFSPHAKQDEKNADPLIISSVIRYEQDIDMKNVNGPVSPNLTIASTPATTSCMHYNATVVETQQRSHQPTANLDKARGFSAGAQQPFPMPLPQTLSTQVKEANTSLFETPQRSHQPAANLDKARRALDFFTGAQQVGQQARVLPTTTAQETVVRPKEEQMKKEREAEEILKVRKERIVADLLQKIHMREQKIAEVRSSVKACKGSLDTEWLEINSVFSEVIKVVEDARQKALQPLEERRQSLKSKAQDVIQKLEKEIDKLKKTIDALDKHPDLQGSLRTDLDESQDWRNVTADTSFSFSTLRTTTSNMMEQIHQKLDKLSSVELKRIPTFAVDVKLDPATAHGFLVLSPDGKKVRDGGKNQNVPDGPGRFDMYGSVLGLNRLTSGKSYWEVEVSNKTGWDLGVARRDANRKGKLSLTPEEGYWVTVHYEDEKYAALTDPSVSLALAVKPQKVGVFVDYEEGLVSFYNVTAQSHIYSFTECSFSDELFPYFSPHLKQEEKNSDPLIISAVKKQS